MQYTQSDMCFVIQAVKYTIYIYRRGTQKTQIYCQGGGGGVLPYCLLLYYYGGSPCQPESVNVLLQRPYDMCCNTECKYEYVQTQTQTQNTATVLLYYYGGSPCQPESVNVLLQRPCQRAGRSHWLTVIQRQGG